MVRGEGIYFWDADGKRYVDMNSQLMCVNIGHGDKRVIDAIKRQADELVYAGPGMATPVRARVGKMLADLTPGDLNRFFFTLGGAEANENAIRIARMVTGRQKIMVRYRSYHGATAGAISLTGDPRRWANEPGIPGVVRFFDPYKYRSHLYREGDSDADVRAALPRRDRRDHRVRRRPHDRRDVRRDGHRHQRDDRPAGRLPPGPARDLRPPRHSPRLRRSDVRPRPHRQVVRGRSLERHPRHDHDGQRDSRPRICRSVRWR